jgi:hypothetical protein
MADPYWNTITRSLTPGVSQDLLALAERSFLLLGGETAVNSPAKIAQI